MPTPERTSFAAIVAAAREILEDAGVSGLTMQAVAIRVGVRAPSLYKRIRDRDALLTAVAESAVDELADRLGRSEADLTAAAHAYRAFAHEHPETFRLIFTTAAPVRALERASAPVLRAASAVVGHDDALNAARMFTAWATGFLQMELAGAFRLGGDVDEAFEYGLRGMASTLANARLFASNARSGDRKAHVGRK